MLACVRNHTDTHSHSHKHFTHLCFLRVKRFAGFCSSSSKQASRLISLLACLRLHHPQQFHKTTTRSISPIARFEQFHNCRSSQIGSQATDSQSALPSPTPLSLKSLGMSIMCKNPDINPSPTFPTCTPLGKIAAEPLALHAASVRSRSRAGLRREWTERKG